MKHYYTAEQIRDAEAPLLAALPDGVLMRRAAYGLAAVIAAELRRRTGAVAGRHVCAVVGSGNNGGDALWAATFLRRRRGVAAAAVLLSPEHTHAAALSAFRSAGGRVVETVSAATDVVIDGVVGISASGPLRLAAANVFAAVEAAGIPVVAVDIPSGVDVHTGAVTGPAVNAAVTVTFGGQERSDPGMSKRGQERSDPGKSTRGQERSDPGKSTRGLKPVHALAGCGRVELIDIGLDLPAADLVGMEADDVKRLWPRPGPRDDKYTQGVVGVAAGSAAYPGAAILCSGAAVAATSGMVRYAGSAAAEVVSHWPEVVAAPSVENAGRVQAWVVGPGLGTDEPALEALNWILGTEVPVIVDADALTMLAAHPHLVRERTSPTVLTPHAGEYARFGLGEVGEDRVAAARRLADALGATVLLKGNVTVIADPYPTPTTPTYLNPAGGSWAATAGSGDVLSGIIGALLASGLSPGGAAAAAAFVHARAANAAAADPGPTPVPTSASAILSHIRPALARL